MSLDQLLSQHVQDVHQRVLLMSHVLYHVSCVLHAAMPHVFRMLLCIMGVCCCDHAHVLLRVLVVPGVEY
jgi:hypothetical protein